MYLVTCILATITSYQGMVVLPHDQSSGLVGISPTNGVIYESTTIKLSQSPELQLGQLVSVTENIQVDGRRTDRFISSIQILGKGTPPTFSPVSAKVLNRGDAVGKFVTFKGVVQDVFRDDIDPRFIVATIVSGPDRVLWSGACKIGDSQLSELIGATVEASGRAVPGSFTSRRVVGPSIFSTSAKSLKILTKPNTNPFDLPDITLLEHARPSDIAFQPRHRTSGFVSIVIDAHTFLLHRTNDTFSTIHLAFSRVPKRGDFVEVIGFPESDLYTINLARANWRMAIPPHPCLSTNAATNCTITRLLPEVDGVTVPRARLHGHLLRVCGTLRRIPLPDEPTKSALIESDGAFLEISPGVTPRLFEGLMVGAEIAITGIAFVEKEHWRPNLCFPKITKTILIPRGPEDIEILAGPPFWTQMRLLTLIVLLVGVVITMIVRNGAIHRLSDERIKERTRLAVELHDTIAQNLAGAAIQLETAETLVPNGSDRLKQILSSAIKIMHISREELRDCIWDLRNKTLDEKHVEDALRRILTPCLNGTRLKLRFPVNRADITDSSMHAAISITRELVSNALHHGHPSCISIAGTLEGSHMLFSITDNGIGFDIEHSPGPREGHFGITGIRERVRKLNGTFCIKSKCGKGTKATISIQR